MYFKGAIIQNIIITFKFQFAVFSQFVHNLSILYRYTSYSNVAWFNMIYNIYSKVEFSQMYALKIDLSWLKISNISQIGDGAQPPPQTPPHAERKNRYCGRTTFHHLAPPLLVSTETLDMHCLNNWVTHLIDYSSTHMNTFLLSALICFVYSTDLYYSISVFV